MGMRAILVLWIIGHATAVSTNALFSDHMVLQSSAGQSVTPPTTFYGTATHGATVALTFSPSFPGSPYQTTAAKDGTWSIQISPDPPNTRGPFNLTLSEPGGDVVTAHDVLFGEVFLCSGQSNMERTVSYIANATAEISAANYPNMRLFQRSSAGATPNGPWSVPSREMNGSCIWPGGGGAKACTDTKRLWTAVTPQVIGSFSAICYLTARDLLLMLGTDQPIGLIESDWGGTPVQAWTPAAGLESCGMSTTNCTTEKGGNCSHYPSKLFNHMVTPFLGYGLRSVLWYQGEANSDEGFPLSRENYTCVFARMIQEWRQAWNAPTLPFLFVQLSAWTGNWGFDNLTCVPNYCPVISRIRLAQADIVGQSGGPAPQPVKGTPGLPLAATAMAVSYDQGDNQAHGVHPRFKSEPARRLARQLLKLAFNKTPPDQGDYSGPLPVSAHGTGRGVEVMVRLSHSAGLRLNDTQTCGEQDKGLCCRANQTAFGARVCTMADPEACSATPADNKTVFDASVSIAGDGSILFSSAQDFAADSGPTFVEFGVTDFPQCSVVNSDHIALGPFGPLQVQS